MVYNEDIEELVVSTRMKQIRQIKMDFLMNNIKSPLPPLKRGGCVD